MVDCTIVTSVCGTFTFPNYPIHYDNNLDVCWLIVGQNSVRISFQFLSNEPSSDYVRVFDGNSRTDPLLLNARGNRAGSNNHSVVSSTNQMLVVFTSDSHRSYRGFAASYSSCSMLTTTGSNTGVITSPNYPNHYNNDDSVCWIISQPAGYTISLSFDSFYTQPIMDFVDVHDGSSTSSLLLLSASGFTLPRNVTSKSNEMIIVFLSDGSKVFRGFKATFTVLTSNEILLEYAIYKLMIASINCHRLLMLLTIEIPAVHHKFTSMAV